MISAKMRSAVPTAALRLYRRVSRPGYWCGCPVHPESAHHRLDDAELVASPCRNALALPGAPLCPFLPAIAILVYTSLVVVHFVSDRRLRWGESQLSGHSIRFVPGTLIRFHGVIHSSKVMAKLQNSLVVSCG
jgi:hypothetical protein